MRKEDKYSYLYRREVKKLRMYDFTKARSIVQKKWDLIETALLGIHEDWFWTAEAIMEKGMWTHSLEAGSEIAGIQGSSWATPALKLEYKDGTEEFIECFNGEAEESQPSWFSLGSLSASVQENIQPIKKE